MKKPTTNPLSSRIDRDKLNLVSRDRVAAGAHAVLDPIQGYTPEQLIASVAVAFAVVAERSGVKPSELYQMGKRMLHDEDRYHMKANVQMESLRDFAAQEIRNKN
ncbi:MAG: hypothetical protein JJ891_06955 [Rhizobiaceae bacterium]|nr:hypothetical protein [Rhizobiaceae bacterium]